MCADLTTGGEAAIHVMHSIFETDDTDTVLPIFFLNAFNEFIEQRCCLHNIRIMNPSISTYAINTNREPGRLFIMGGKELTSAEGTTQRDPLAMNLYAVSLQPLITRLNSSSFTKQCWYVDDETGAGPLRELRKWWDVLNEMRPSLGYYRNAKKNAG